MVGKVTLISCKGEGVRPSRIMTQCLIITELYISHLGLLLTKYHRRGSLNNRHVFLTVQEAGKSKIKLPADSGDLGPPAKGPISYRVVGARELSGVSLIRELMTFARAQPL